MDVVIDTDPGGDDAIALMWLASLVRQGRVNLIAVSTAAGNVGARMTYRNATGILSLCGLDGVKAGIAPPGCAPRDAAEVHGSDGLGGLAGTLPETQTPAGSPQDSADLLADCLTGAAQDPQLLAVAPLTNLARAEAATPGALRHARDLIVMGGALGPGNITRKAEFNFHCDPVAAKVVLAARAETRLVTLETSQALLLTQERVQGITRALKPGPAVGFFAGLCRFMSERDARLRPQRSVRGFPVHDAATVAWLAYPELFDSRLCRIEIDTRDGAQRGRIRETGAADSAVCRLARGVDVEAVLERLAADLRSLLSGL